MNKKIIIGSRGSKLALLYAQEAKDSIIQNTGLNDVIKFDLRFLDKIQTR